MNLVNFNASSGKSENLHFDEFILSKIYKALYEKVQKSYVVMFHDTEKWFKQKITLEKYAFSVWCNRLGAVREKYSGSAGNIFDNCLAWSSFYS